MNSRRISEHLKWRKKDWVCLAIVCSLFDTHNFMETRKNSLLTCERGRCLWKHVQFYKSFIRCIFRKGDLLTTEKAINELMRPNTGLFLNCKLLSIVYAPWYKKEEEMKAEESCPPTASPLQMIPTCNRLLIFSSSYIIKYCNKQRNFHATIETYVTTPFLPTTAIAWKLRIPSSKT